MTERTPIELLLDGQAVTAQPGETLWALAERHGVRLPHLCHRPAEAGRHPGLPTAGNCRACLVEIAGERTLAASCCRQATPGLEVHTSSERALRARQVVLELLADEAGAASAALAPASELTYWCRAHGIEPANGRAPTTADRSHPAIHVDLGACIGCTRCVRACRDVQGNDVIAIAGRGTSTRIVFDNDRPLGESSCVACGECVEACPTGALAPAQDGLMRSIARTVDTVCPYCGVGCQLTLHVGDNDHIAYVTGRDGPANHGRLCVKGRYGFDYVHHPARLRTPMIRRQDAPKDVADIERFHRGEITLADRFRPARWDETLERAAEGFRRLRDAARARGDDVPLAGFGSAKGSNEEAYLFQKLIRTGFGTHNVDHCTRLCHASSVAALLEGIGSGAVSNPVADVARAEVIFLIGANPVANHPVAATWIKNAVDRGARLILADPRETPLARRAWRHLAFRPDTDVALLTALLHVIIADGLTDPAFIAARVDGFNALAEAVAAANPEAMGPICGIAPETLREVAHAYARAESAMILWGMGISQHVHGTDNARCLIALAAVSGQIGRPGTGLHPLRGQNNVQGASDAGLIPMMLPNYRRVTDADARAAFSRAWGLGPDALAPTPGLTVVETMQAIAAGRIRGLYVMGENPAMSDPDLAHTRAALARLDHLVVQDIFPTETALLADVLLPASAHYEKWGTSTNTDRLIQLGRPALDPPGDARQDLWLIAQIARRLGLPWDVWRSEDGTGRRSSAQAVARVYEEMRLTMPPLTGVPWHRLEREGAVQTPCDTETSSGDAVIFRDRFATANGRAQLGPLAYAPGPEQPDPAYPFVLTTGRVLEHWHTGAMTRRSLTLDTLAPEATVSMHPEDARSAGLADGQSVRVATRHGEVAARLRYTSTVKRGTLFMPFAYWEAAANMLTGAALDPVGRIPGFKVTAARLVPDAGCGAR